ncbi:hypothetical protein AAMO2058_000773700 [Amorphochlora amoebiformis]
MSVVSLFAALALQGALIIRAEEPEGPGTCQTDGECGLSEVKSDPISVTVYNNGVNDGGVAASLEFTNDITKLGEELAKLVDANKTLLEHQREEFGFGKTWQLWTGNGTRVTSFSNMTDGDNIYVVPSGLLFMWPTIAINHTVVLHDVSTTNGRPVTIRTLNHSPMVFELENLLTPEEAEGLRKAALTVEHKGNKFQRSTTGHTGNVDPYRTSDNAFVHSESPIAIKLTKRAFEVLRMKHDPMLGDGIQVLRYNSSGGYRWHTDWFPEKTVYGRNHDVTRGGANRFATVFFYLSDVEWGGQTGFPEAEGDTSELATSMEMAKTMFAPNSWEIQAVEKCFGKFSVKPAKGRAILFYSLEPNGKGDRMSMHTGCPVLEGQKWAANLWVWNKDRDPPRTASNDTKMTVKFVNKMDETALVSWVTNPRHVQGTMIPGQSLEMSTYDGDSFVFRDTTRTKILAKWKADLSKGKYQVIRIDRQSVDDEGNVKSFKPSEVHITLENNKEFPVSIFWQGSEGETLVSSVPNGGSRVLQSWDTHKFHIKDGYGKLVMELIADLSKGHVYTVTID